MDMEKTAGISVGAIGFAILVIALDFAVVRAAWLSPTPLHPAELTGRLLSGGAFGWAVFAFFLLPMINALLIGVYRLRRRGGHTAGTVGFIIAGSAATSAVFASCLISPGTAFGMVTPISRPIALASFHALAWLSGHGELLYRGPLNWTYGIYALEWTYAVVFAVLIPIAFFCIPPLLVAVIGGRVARYLDVAGPSLPGPPRHGPER
jgi:hypothetical protein